MILPSSQLQTNDKIIFILKDTPQYIYTEPTPLALLFVNAANRKSHRKGITIMGNIFIIMTILPFIYYTFRWIVKKNYFTHLYLSSLVLSFGVILFVLALLFNAEQSFEAALQGIQLCINVVFPSLFPFFVTTDLLTSLGLVHAVSIILEPIMRPVFNVPGSGAFPFAMGIISGYPVGAKATVNLRENHLCTRAEGERLLAFCNNAGPLFILGAIAVGMFHNPLIGSLLYLTHFLASITVGLFFRFYKYDKKIEPQGCVKKNSFRGIIKETLKQMKNYRTQDPRNFGEMFGDAIRNAVNLLLLIAGFIIFFSVLIKLLTHLGIIASISQILSIFCRPLGISEELLPAISSGFFEITTGIKLASSDTAIPLVQRLTAASLILGWAGLSVHCQVISIISKTDIRVGPYLVGKAMHGILAATYTFLLFNVAPLTISVSKNISEPLEKFTQQHFTRTFSVSLIYLGNVLFFFTLLCIFVMIANTKGHKQRD